MKSIRFFYVIITVLLFTSSCEEKEENQDGIVRGEMPTSEFLKFSNREDLIEVMSNSSLQNFWKITTLQKGEEDFAERFSEVKIIFNERVSTAETTLVEGPSFEPIDFTFPNLFPSNTFITNFFSDVSSDDLRATIVSSFLSTIPEDIEDKEKYEILNSVMPQATPEGVIGYRVQLPLDGEKITFITTTENGEVRKVVFEKMENTGVIDTPIDEREPISTLCSIEILDLYFNESNQPRIDFRALKDFDAESSSIAFALTILSNEGTPNEENIASPITVYSLPDLEGLVSNGGSIEIPTSNLKRGDDNTIREGDIINGFPFEIINVDNLDFNASNFSFRLRVTQNALNENDIIVNECSEIDSILLELP